MLKKIYSRPLYLVVFIFLVVISSVISIKKLPVKMYPNVIKPGFTIWFGHQYIKSPRDLYLSYGKELEDKIQDLDEITEIESDYNAGRAQLVLNSDWNVDEITLKEKIESLFNTTKSQAPNEFWYEIRSSSEQSSGNLMLSVSSSHYSSEELKQLLKNTLRPRLEKIPGIKDVDFWGWFEKQVALSVDRDKFLSFNLNFSDVVNDIRSRYMTRKIGNVDGVNTKEPNQLFIQAKIQETDDILNQTMKLSENTIIKYSDFASIKEHFKMPKALYQLNSVPATYMSANLKADGDVKRACEQVIEELEGFKNDLNDKIDYNVLVNPADYVKTSINNLILNGMIGGLIAFLIIFIFLGSFFNSLIISVSIPFCVVATFILMKLHGLTINIISLGGIAIGVGMIVDSSIVCLENIFLKIKNFPERPKIQNVFEATKEVTLPIIASIATSVVAFFPIMYTASYTKAILGELAETVIYTLLTSIIAAIYIVPCFSNFFMTAKKVETKGKFFDSVHNIGAKIQKFYLNSLKKYLSSIKAQVTVIISINILLFLSFSLIPKIKKEIMARPATDLLDIRVRIPQNDDIKLTKKYVSKLENFLKSREEILSYSTYLWKPDFGYVTAKLSSREDFPLMKKLISQKFPPSSSYDFSADKWDPGGLPLPDKQDILLHVSGTPWEKISDNVDRIENVASKHEARVRRRPWKDYSSDITIDFHNWVDEQSDLRNYVSAHSESGHYIMDVFSDGEGRPLVIIFDEKYRYSFLEDVKQTPVLYKDALIPLKALASVESIVNPFPPLHFINGEIKHKVMITIEDDKVNKEELLTKIDSELKNMKLDNGILMSFEDSNKDLSDAYKSFQTSLIVSMVLIFAILVIMFDSIRYPAIILITIPFALIGVISGLYIFGSTLSLNSMLGTILLNGLVVNNAILMIDHFKKQELHEGTFTDRIISSCKRRLRPIIMTTLTTLFGILPMALGLGEGGEILRPLGISVFSGLFVSTFLCLYIIPSLIYLSELLIIKFQQRKSRLITAEV